MKKSKFKLEFKKQLRLAIAAAIGFLIAYSWRDFIFNLSKGFITSLYEQMGPHLVNFTSSILITLLGVLIILGTSKILER